MDEVSVLIVDDQLPFRLAARRVIQRATGFTVVADLDGGEHVAETVQALRPDLVLMDVKMPGVDGIEATRRALEAVPGTAVFLCSTYPLAELPDAALTCGASAYLRKEQLNAANLRQLWETRSAGGLRTVSG
jgi:DNA-binding NarL/FixJ family response regulator